MILINAKYMTSNNYFIEHGNEYALFFIKIFKDLSNFYYLFNTYKIFISVIIMCETIIVK